MRSVMLPPYSGAELKSAKALLLADIAEAIAAAVDVYPESIGPTVCLNNVPPDEVCLCEACLNTKVWPDRFVRFNALGTSYKVLNLKARLRAFKGNIESCAGFKTLPVKGPHKSSMEKLGNGSVSHSAIRELMDGGDLTAACALAEQGGKPLVFTGGTHHPRTYGEAEEFYAEGFDGLDLVSARLLTRGSPAWSIIELSTGMTLGISRPSRDISKSVTSRELEKIGVEQFVLNVNHAPKVSQETLREQWLAWAEVEEVLPCQRERSAVSWPTAIINLKEKCMNALEKAAA